MKSCEATANFAPLRAHRWPYTTMIELRKCYPRVANRDRAKMIRFPGPMSKIQKQGWKSFNQF